MKCQRPAGTTAAAAVPDKALGCGEKLVVLLEVDPNRQRQREWKQGTRGRRGSRDRPRAAEG